MRLSLAGKCDAKACVLSRPTMKFAVWVDGLVAYKVNISLPRRVACRPAGASAFSLTVTVGSDLLASAVWEVAVLTWAAAESDASVKAPRGRTVVA